MFDTFSEGFAGLIPALPSGDSAQIIVKARAVTAPEVTLNILSPPVIGGSFPAKGAGFGERLSDENPLTGMVLLASDGVDTSSDGV